MTKEEAIEALKFLPQNMEISGNTSIISNFLYAISVGAEAIEKDIPKPLTSTPEFKDGCCSNCGSPIQRIEDEHLSGMTHCPYCGQKYRER